VSARPANHRWTAGAATLPPRPPADVDEWGTAEASWLPALDALPDWSIPVSPGRAVVIAPHPDDETLGAGGLLATLVERGWEVLVVAVTDGEAAYGHDAASGPGGPELARRRRDEQARALRALAGGDGVTVHRLSVADGAVGDHLGSLVDSLRRDLDGADLCVAPLAWDGHPDHDACGEAALAALAALARAGRCPVPVVQYPIWAWHWATPAEMPLERLRRVVLRPAARRRKHRATACFVSQRTPPPGCPTILPPHVMARFERPFEVLLT